MSKLDAAFTAAKNDPKQKSQFYNVFLNTELYIPTRAEPQADGDSAAPLIAEQDGIRYLLLFDSSERMNNWAQRDIEHVQLPGHSVAEAMAGDYHWALNVGTAYLKTFVPDEIAWLKQRVAQAKREQSKQSAGGSVLIRKLRDVAEQTLAPLRRALASQPLVQRGYLGQVRYAIANEPPHLTLVIGGDDAEPASLQALREPLTTALAAAFPEAEKVAVLVEGESAVTKEVVKAIAPFYVQHGAD